MNKEQAIKLVQEQLNQHQPAEYRLEVDASSTRMEDDWWFVGVRPSRRDIRRYDYYDIMAQVSREIEDATGENITLVPPPSGIR